MRGRDRVLALFATAALTALASASLALNTLAAAPAQTQASGVREVPNVVFATVPGYRPLLLDLYLPADAIAPTPTILWVHGGG